MRNTDLDPEAISRYKLSICIPTYNRSGYLRRCLSIVIPQVKEFGDRIELVISDNCSTDDTKLVVDEYSKQYPIHYYKNDKNYGINHNILFIAQSRAAGEFCWILGDDDQIRDGTIRNLMRILDNEEGIDFVFVNFLIETVDENAKIAAFQGRIEDPKINSLIGSMDLKEGRKDFDRILSDDMFSLSAIYSSVFRFSVCRESALRFNISEEFSNLESTFTITLIFIDTMHGRTGYSTGTPWLVCGTRASWSRFSFAANMRMSDLFDYQELHGIPHELVEVRRKAYIHNGAGTLPYQYFINKLRNPETPYLDEFKVFRFIIRYCRYSEFYRVQIWLIKSLMLSLFEQNDRTSGY